MRNFFYFAIVISFSLTSCNSEKLLFEKETWWQGHWQNSDDQSMFFSIGSKPVGPFERGTTQFFLSTEDSIYSNFHLVSLVDFNYRKKWKVIATNDNQLIKIVEVEKEDFEPGSGAIELYGPAKSQDELDTIRATPFRRFSGMLPLIPDSILFVP